MKTFLAIMIFCSMFSTTEETTVLVRVKDNSTKEFIYGAKAEIFDRRTGLRVKEVVDSDSTGNIKMTFAAKDTLKMKIVLSASRYENEEFFYHTGPSKGSKLYFTSWMKSNP